jgi:hypothetical protein
MESETRAAEDESGAAREAGRGRAQSARLSKLTGPPMKKLVLSIEEPGPKKKSLRADRSSTEGFTVVVDGHFKSDFETVDVAEASGRKLKSTYPMLKIEIYDAATRVRALLS